MMDRLLSTTMNFTVMALITATAGGALVLGYWGLVELCNGHASGGGFAVFAALGPAALAVKLAQYKNDLADR